MPTRRRSGGTQVAASAATRPATSTVPASGRSNPATSRSNVVFPHPTARAVRRPRHDRRTERLRRRRRCRRTAWSRRPAGSSSTPCKGNLTADSRPIVAPRPRIRSPRCRSQTSFRSSQLARSLAPSRTGSRKESKLGDVVTVPLGGRRVRGVVVELDSSRRPGFRSPSPARSSSACQEAVELALWVADYYGSTPARALALVAPHMRSRRGARREVVLEQAIAGEPEPAELTPDQKAAVTRIVGALTREGATSSSMAPPEAGRRRCTSRRVRSCSSAGRRDRHRARDRPDAADRRQVPYALREPCRGAPLGAERRRAP